MLTVALGGRCYLALVTWLQAHRLWIWTKVFWLRIESLFSCSKLSPWPQTTWRMLSERNNSHFIFPFLSVWGLFLYNGAITLASGHSLKPMDLPTFRAPPSTCAPPHPCCNRPHHLYPGIAFVCRTWEVGGQGISYSQGQKWLSLMIYILKHLSRLLFLVLDFSRNTMQNKPSCHFRWSCKQAVCKGCLAFSEHSRWACVIVQASGELFSMPLVRNPWNDFHLLKGARLRQTFISVILKEKIWMGFLQFISCFCHFVCILEFFVLGVCCLVWCRKVRSGNVDLLYLCSLRGSQQDTTEGITAYGAPFPFCEWRGGITWGIS